MYVEVPIGGCSQPAQLTLTGLSKCVQSSAIDATDATAACLPMVICEIEMSSVQSAVCLATYVDQRCNSPGGSKADLLDAARQTVGVRLEGGSGTSSWVEQISTA